MGAGGGDQRIEIARSAERIYRQPDEPWNVDAEHVAEIPWSEGRGENEYADNGA